MNTNSHEVMCDRNTYLDNPALDYLLHSIKTVSLSALTRLCNTGQRHKLAYNANAYKDNEMQNINIQQNCYFWKRTRAGRSIGVSISSGNIISLCAALYFFNLHICIFLGILTDKY